MLPHDLLAAMATPEVAALTHPDMDLVGVAVTACCPANAVYHPYDQADVRVFGEVNDVCVCMHVCICVYMCVCVYIYQWCQSMGESQFYVFIFVCLVDDSTSGVGIATFSVVVSIW